MLSHSDTQSTADTSAQLELWQWWEKAALQLPGYLCLSLELGRSKPVSCSMLAEELCCRDEELQESCMLHTSGDDEKRWTNLP